MEFIGDGRLNSNVAKQVDHTVKVLNEFSVWLNAHKENQQMIYQEQRQQ